MRNRSGLRTGDDGLGGFGEFEVGKDVSHVNSSVV